MRKRVAVFHSLASYGGTSLMSIIPLMYSKGIEISPIPTMLFTSHGAFNGVKSKENTEFIDAYTSQWAQLKLHFNGIYLGLFTNNSQILSTLKFIERFGKDDCLIVLDPILGDNGKLYSFMDKAIIDGIRRLACKAHIITPNLTEACLLLNKKCEENLPGDVIYSYLRELSNLGPENIIITSVPSGDSLDTYIYKKATDSYKVISRRKLSGYYPGTGDAFTSIVMSEVLNGCNIIDAVIKAAELVEKGISIILEKGLNPLEGLPLSDEELLHTN